MNRNTMMHLEQNSRIPDYDKRSFYLTNSNLRNTVHNKLEPHHDINVSSYGNFGNSSALMNNMPYNTALRRESIGNIGNNMMMGNDFFNQNNSRVQLSVKTSESGYHDHDKYESTIFPPKRGNDINNAGYNPYVEKNVHAQPYGSPYYNTDNNESTLKHYTNKEYNVYNKGSMKNSKYENHSPLKAVHYGNPHNFYEAQNMNPVRKDVTSFALMNINNLTQGGGMNTSQNMNASKYDVHRNQSIRMTNNDNYMGMSQVGYGRGISNNFDNMNSYGYNENYNN